MPSSKKTTLYVGDVHAQFHHLSKLAKHTDASELVVVGDFGYGFHTTPHEPFKPKKPISFIRGNHDNPSVRTGFNWKGFSYLPDGTFKNGTLFAGGAFSIDWGERTQGKDWWPEEELSETEWEAIFKKAEGHKDEIHTVVTHDCPWSLYSYLHSSPIPSRTSRNLDALRTLLPQVNLWVFGHHHQSLNQTLGHTTFIGLDIIDTWDSLLV
jgi:predicted phosphodiesterase